MKANPKINPGKGYRLLKPTDRPDRRHKDEFFRPDDNRWIPTGQCGYWTVAESIGAYAAAYRRPIKDPTINHQFRYALRSYTAFLIATKGTGDQWAEIERRQKALIDLVEGVAK